MSVLLGYEMESLGIGNPRFETSGSFFLDTLAPEDETIMFSGKLGSQYSIMKHHILEEIPNRNTLEKSDINQANEKWES